MSRAIDWANQGAHGKTFTRDKTRISSRHKQYLHELERTGFRRMYNSAMAFTSLKRWLSSTARPGGRNAPLSAAEIRKRKEEIVSKYGGWLASHIELSEGIATEPAMTGGSSNLGVWSKYQALSQMILAFTAQPISGLRILDLAVHEGATSIEL